MRPVNSIGAAIALFIVAGPAHATDWRYVISNKTKTDFYYDLDTIQLTENLVTVWEKWDHSRDKTQKLRERRIRTTYDCSDRTFTALTVIEYKIDGTNSSVEWAPHERNWKNPAPETVAEAMLEEFCGKN